MTEKTTAPAPQPYYAGQPVPPGRASESARSWMVGLLLLAFTSGFVALLAVGDALGSESYYGGTSFNTGAGVAAGLAAALVWLPWVGVFSVARTALAGAGR